MLDIQNTSDYQKLRIAIEKDPESFCLGRRNDDVVNWYFAIALEELQKGNHWYEWTVDEIIGVLDYVLEDYQRVRLNDWDECWQEKIRLCHDLYRNYSLEDIINLWIDQGGYKEPQD